MSLEDLSKEDVLWAHEMEIGHAKAEIERLEAENAALRERLEKAVELKAKVGDTIYMPWVWAGGSGKRSKSLSSSRTRG